MRGFVHGLRVMAWFCGRRKFSMDIRQVLMDEVFDLIHGRINGCTENNAAGAAELVVDCVILPVLKHGDVRAL